MPDAPLNRVLVIEDDPDTRQNLRDLLEIDGCDVESAETLAAALTRDDWSRFSVIILDWLLPDGNAAALLPKLADHAPHASVIVSTGTREFDGAILALRHGAVDYILKPINPDALRASVGRIIARKRLDHTLQTTQRRVQALFECTLDAILLADDGGRPVDANPAAVALFGRPRDDLVATAIHDLIAPDSLRDFASLWTETANGGRSNVELRVRHSGGREIDVEFHAVGRVLPSLHLCVLRDITERRQSQERLLQAGRLAAIGEAMTGLAHESRNALQRSQACLEMLLRRMADRPDAVELIARIQRAQDDLHQLYEEVREYAAPIRLSPADCPLDELLLEVWDELALARNGRTARLEVFAAEPPLCRVDRFGLRQVFRNILENSLAACTDPVEITARFESDGPAAKLTVSLRDNGPGLTSEQRQRIFDAFFTTKTHGTGLGMAIVRRIVEAHGGAIRAAEPDGPGAEIVIDLPRTSS